MEFNDLDGELAVSGWLNFYAITDYRSVKNI